MRKCWLVALLVVGGCPRLVSRARGGEGHVSGVPAGARAAGSVTACGDPQDADTAPSLEEETRWNRHRSTRTSWDPPAPPSDPEQVIRLRMCRLPAWLRTLSGTRPTKRSR